MAYAEHFLLVSLQNRTSNVFMTRHKDIHTLLLALLLSLSAPAVLAEEDEAETDGQADAEATMPARSHAVPYPHARRHQAVLEYLQLNQRQQEAVTLIADEQTFYGLFLRERSGQPQGGALLLHDLEQHGHWPELIAPLREALPDHGWTTLAIELPTPTPAPLPPRPEPTTDTPDDAGGDTGESSEDEPVTTAATEPEDTQADPDDNDGINAATEPQDDVDDTQGGDPADMSAEPPLPPLGELPQPDAPSPPPPADEPAPDLRQKFAAEVRSRIASGLEYLGQRGQLNLVLIASGDSAVWAAGLIEARQRDNDNARGIALVLIDAREHPASQLTLTQVLETLDVPVLDLVTADNRTPEWSVRERRGAMARRHRGGYQQIRLEGSGHANPLVVRRIRGWLKTNAAGTELKDIPD